MGEPWLLALDLGTSGLKVGGVSLTGELLDHEFARLTTRRLPGGGAVQDPESWWEAVRICVAPMLARDRLRAADLAGVGITGQWGSTVPVEESGRAAGDCLLWCDTRGAEHSSRVMGGRLAVLGYSPGNMLRWLRYTGGAPSPRGADPLGHEMHLRHDEPDVLARAVTLLEPLDYLGLRFTGRPVATPASMVLSWLTDNRPGREAVYVDQLVRRSGRDRTRLPELAPTGAVVGGITQAAAGELGLPAGVPVVAGVPDLHSAYLGSGAVAPYAAHVTISTTAWVSCEVPFKRTDVLHQMASVPGVRPGGDLVANNHESAGSCLDWLRDRVLGGTYEELVGAATRAPAGAGGLIFTPWLDGERSPVEDRTLRGAYLNLAMTSDRDRIVRALLEGVAYNARWLLDAVEGFLKRPVPSLRILGGGAQSDLWCQIHADVLGRRLERVAQPMFAGLRGAAMFAAISLGRLTLAEVPALVPVDRVFEPGPDARAYEPLYREFKGLYRRLRGTYARLNRDA